MAPTQPAEQRAQRTLYLAIGALSLALTLAAVFIVVAGIARPLALPLLIALAVVQVLMQAFLFMHLRGSRHLYTYFFLGGVMLAILMASCLMVLIQQWA